MNLQDRVVEITGTRFCLHDPYGVEDTFGEDLIARTLDPGATVEMYGARQFTARDVLGAWSIHTAYRLVDGTTWVQPVVFPSVASSVTLTVHDGTEPEPPAA